MDRDILEMLHQKKAMYEGFLENPTSHGFDNQETIKKIIEIINDAIEATKINTI